VAAAMAWAEKVGKGELEREDARAARLAEVPKGAMVVTAVAEVAEAVGAMATVVASAAEAVVLVPCTR